MRIVTTTGHHHSGFQNTPGRSLIVKIYTIFQNSQGEDVMSRFALIPDSLQVSMFYD